MMSRLFLVDHLLRNGVGHHLGYNLAIAEAAARRSIPVEILAAREWKGQSAEGATATPHFHRDRRADPPAWLASRFHLLQALEKWSDWRFALDLRRLPSMSARDAIFAQMIAPRHFVRWLSWMAKCPVPPVLFLHLGYRPERFDSSAVRNSINSLAEPTRNRVVFVTDSEKLATAFENILGEPVHYLPHIVSYPLKLSGPPSPSPVIYLPGNARREKGFAEVVGAVRCLLAPGSAVRLKFVLQCNHPDAVSAEILRSRPPAGPSLEWVEKPLSEEDYIQRIASADVVLLPYHTDLYEGRTSGIFCECRVSGKPVIASRGTWAGDRVAREGGGWLVRERVVEDLVSTLQRVPAEIGALSAEARDLAPQARREFNRDAFLDAMIQLFEKASNHAA